MPRSREQGFQVFTYSRVLIFSGSIKYYLVLKKVRINLERVIVVPNDGMEWLN